MQKVVIKISQGSVVTQTALGGLTIHLPVANFLCFISAKKYENWLRVDKVIAMNTVCSFFGPPCIMVMLFKQRYVSIFVFLVILNTEVCVMQYKSVFVQKTVSSCIRNCLPTRRRNCHIKQDKAAVSS